MLIPSKLLSTSVHPPIVSRRQNQNQNSSNASPANHDANANGNTPRRGAANITRDPTQPNGRGFGGFGRGEGGALGGAVPKPGVIGGGVVPPPGEGKAPGVLGGGFGGVGKRIGRGRGEGTEGASGETNLTRRPDTPLTSIQDRQRMPVLGELPGLLLATLKAYLALGDRRPPLLPNRRSTKSTNRQSHPCRLSRNLRRSSVAGESDLRPSREPERRMMPRIRALATLPCNPPALRSSGERPWVRSDRVDLPLPSICRSPRRRRACRSLPRLLRPRCPTATQHSSFPSRYTRHQHRRLPRSNPRSRMFTVSSGSTKTHRVTNTVSPPARSLHQSALG